MNGQRFRAWWPIIDRSVPEGMRLTQAAQEIDAIAAETGVAISGTVTWYEANGYLIGESAFRPLRVDRKSVPYGYVARQYAVIRVLAEVRGLPDWRIADIFGCSESAIAKVRGKHGIAAAHKDFPPEPGSGSVAAETSSSSFVDGTATDPSASALAVAA